jgi:hypothetical protein
MSEVKSFASSNAMDVFINEHRNATQGGYILNFTSNDKGKFDLSYIIQYNDTETHDEAYNTIYPFIYTVVPFQYNLLKVHGKSAY